MYIDNRANNVVNEVIIVRDKVSFIDVFDNSNILIFTYCLLYTSDAADES